MPRVLFLMPRWDDPTELFLQRQLRMLADANVLEGIITDDPGGTVRWRERIPVHGLSETKLSKRLMRAAGHRLGLDWGRPSNQSAMLQKLLQSSRTDTILCHWGDYAVQFRSILVNSRQRLFVHLHGYDTHEELCPVGYRQSLVSLAERATIICNSKDVYGRVGSWGIPHDRLVLKHLGVEVPPAPRLRNGSSEVTILHLGRLVDFKSPDRTIQAFELACERGLQGQLIIAGDGHLRVTCELLTARSKWRNRINLLGAVNAEQGAKLFAEADIFTLHSIRGELTGQVEAFGVAVVEAMAAALPVVSCRIAGVAETVVDGETGILAEPGDVEAQAEALLRLSRDPKLRHALGEAGWRRAKAHFSYEKEQTELLRILKSNVDTNYPTAGANGHEQS